MHDARDAEDNRLLAEGNHQQLVANYVYVVRERCHLRLRDRDAADEAAQLVFLRLLNELRSGRTYPVPFRVVVWKITDWTVAGFYPGAKEDASIPDNWDSAAPDAFAEWESQHDIGLLLADLPEGDRAVADLVYREGLAPGDAAQRLWKQPNAVYQALHRVHRRLAEKLVA
jgi:DNA-directed RNA polymerase specialized sigma24 family protein